VVVPYTHGRGHTSAVLETITIRHDLARMRMSKTQDKLGGGRALSIQAVPCRSRSCRVDPCRAVPIQAVPCGWWCWVVVVVAMVVVVWGGDGGRW